jgi:uncharacterized lipoprotein YmbA
MTRSAIVRTLVLALAVHAGSGCTLPTPQGPAGPISSYVLTPGSAADPMLAAVQPATLAPGLVGVQTVQVPDYLAQQPIVTRTEANQIRIADSAQWAGNLAANITDVVVANLGVVLGGDRVLRLPVSQAVPVETVVGIEISQFERGPDGTVMLAARWVVLGDGGRAFRRIDYASYAAPGVSHDYPVLTRAMSELLAQLSADIARSLAAPPDRPPGRRLQPVS